MITKLDYDQDWEGQFKLDETSPSGLVRIKSKFGNSIKNTPVGLRNFGSFNKPTGWRLEFKGKNYYIHRIIWALTYGSVDSGRVIDHLDGNPFNNKINNLSLKTKADNSRNQRKSRLNTTGTTGVNLTINKKCGNSYYTAQWNELDGKVKKKHFSVLKLGEEAAKALAIAHREEQITRLILEGADYTERHGVESILNKGD